MARGWRDECFRLDAGRGVAVAAARPLLRLPYFSGKMTLAMADGWIRYRRRSAASDSGARFAGGTAFMDKTSPRGIVVHRVRTVQAKALATGDPAVKAGRFAIEAHPWMTLRGILK